ncbi:hypothetical protein CcaverHIS631_0105620 [Cutaneotrichosporon cavernicola]|nr:hypothetical protein CcaverHIS631_0105620 [Cutaneotrichosporon cavernicola]BEJ03388.1 hypothetical protein CcaverHIS641_0105630 [Cutaneotrichosporon cavernicola]
MRTCIDFLLAKKPSTGRILGCGTTSHTTKSASYLLTSPGTLLSPRSYIESIMFDVNRTLSRAEIIHTHSRLVECVNDLETTIAEWVAIPEPKPWSGPIMTFSKSRVAELHENIGVVESALAELADYEWRGTAPKRITFLPKEGEIEVGPFNLIHDMQDGRLFGEAQRCILGLRGQINNPPQTPCEPSNPTFPDSPPPLPPKDKKNSLSSFTSGSPDPAYLGAPYTFPPSAPSLTTANHSRVSQTQAPRRVFRKAVPKVEVVPSTSAIKATANPAKSRATPSGPRRPAIVPTPFTSPGATDQPAGHHAIGYERRKARSTLATPSPTYLGNKPLPVPEPKASHGFLSRLLKPSPTESVSARYAPCPAPTSGIAQGRHRRPPPYSAGNRYYPGWIAGIGAQQVPGP